VIERETPFGLLVAYALPPPTDAELSALWAMLHPEEQQLGAAYGPRRRLTFAGGRVALRRALSVSGLSVPAAILRTSRGAPLLPPGISGSISHKGSVACALVAKEEGGTIGVDVEIEGPDADRFAVLVLTDGERQFVQQRPAEERSFEVVLRLSLKEALYKALDPQVRRYIGFHEVEAWPARGGSARFVLGLEGEAEEMPPEAGADLESGAKAPKGPPEAGADPKSVGPRSTRFEVEGCWFHESGRVFTAARSRLA
jgi:4'-phosphopantetheinyl transferase EntD